MCLLEILSGSLAAQFRQLIVKKTNKQTSKHALCWWGLSGRRVFLPSNVGKLHDRKPPLLGPFRSMGMSS